MKAFAEASALPGDLRLRLLIAAMLVAAMATLSTLTAALAALTLALVLALLARMGPLLWRRLLHAEGFVLLLLLALPVTIPGTALLSAGPLEVTHEGLARAGLMAFKITASLLAITALIGHAEPLHMGAALRSLHMPEPLARLFVLTAHYLVTIRQEFTRLQEAMRARAFVARSNRHTWASYGNLAGMMLVRAMARSERVEEAMRCRSFNGAFPWKPLPRMSAESRLWMLLAAAAALLLILMDRTWTA